MMLLPKKVGSLTIAPHLYYGGHEWTSESLPEGAAPLDAFLKNLVHLEKELPPAL